MFNVSRVFAIAVRATIAVFVIGPSTAGATPLDLTPTGLSFSPCGVCSTFLGRSIYIRVDETITIDSVGWFGNVLSGNYELVISEGLGEANTALGTQVALASASLSGLVLDWNDISISATLNAGQEYVVNLRRADGLPFSTNYHFLSWGNGAEESDLGAVTLLDGREGFNAEGPTNAWTTHFRFEVVPEPSTFAMIVLGLVVLAAIGRRRDRLDCHED